MDIFKFIDHDCFHIHLSRRVFGNMMGGNNPEDDEGSLDSDSDLILDGENDSEDSDEDGKFIIFNVNIFFAFKINTVIRLW